MTTIQISPSQVKSFLECPRKWAWEKIAGFRSPESVGTELGTRVHEILEAYLRAGTPPSYAETWSFHPSWEHDPPTPDHAKQLERSRKRDGTPRVYYPGRIALTMMGPHLPKPGTGKVEGEITWADPRIPGTHWRMYKDWTGGCAILDHKTSSDPDAYGLTVETLPHDAQWIAYAEHLVRTASVRRVKGTWHYGARDASQRKARVVEIVERAEDITRKYEQKIVPVGKLLRRHRAASTNPLDLPPNPDACGNYGGCPHAGRCQLSDSERTGAIARAMSDINEDFDLDALLAEAEETPEPPPVAPDVPEIADVDDALAALGLEDEQPPPHPNDRVNPPEARKSKPAPPKVKSVAYDRQAGEAQDFDMDRLADMVADRVTARLAAAFAAAGK